MLQDFVFVETSHGPHHVMGDKQLMAMARDHPGELILGKTNITTFGLTKFIEVPFIHTKKDSILGTYNRIQKDSSLYTYSESSSL